MDYDVSSPSESESDSAEEEVAVRQPRKSAMKKFVEVQPTSGNFLSIFCLGIDITYVFLYFILVPTYVDKPAHASSSTSGIYKLIQKSTRFIICFLPMVFLKIILFISCIGVEKAIGSRTDRLAKVPKGSSIGNYNMLLLSRVLCLLSFFIPLALSYYFLVPYYAVRYFLSCFVHSRLLCWKNGLD